MKPISVQLYSLREQAKTDFVGVLKTVADIGYAGVEGAGFFNLTPKEFRRIVEDLGMRVSSSHSPFPKMENLAEVIDAVGAMGLKTICGGPNPKHFENLDTIRRYADDTNRMVDALGKAGIQLALHNHSFEFEQFDGRLGYDILMELCPGVQCEIDSYWAACDGKYDPAKIIAKYKSRLPLLHVKDGPFVKDAPHLPVGSGKMDIPAAVNAADPKVLQWLVVELDSCATDMVKAVAKSYEYLVESGLGHGKK